MQRVAAPFTRENIFKLGSGKDSFILPNIKMNPPQVNVCRSLWGQAGKPTSLSGVEEKL